MPSHRSSSAHSLSSGPSKKTGKAKISKKQSVLGSPSICRNLKVNEMLYKKLVEQREKRKAKETSKAAKDEEKRKADEKVATKEKAEEEAAIKKAAKQKTKVAKEKANEKRTKKGIKTAKAKAKKKEAEEADKGQNIMMRMPKMTSKKMMMKMLMLLLNLKQELLAELEAIKKAAEKEAKASIETGDNDVNVNETAGAKQTDNEEDAEESDDVEQALNKIPTMPFLNTSTRSKKKEVDKAEPLLGGTTPAERHNGFPSGTLLVGSKACMLDSFALEMLPELVLDAGFFVLVLNFIFTSFLRLFLASLVLG
ncbi:hypothetical protein Tco_1262043 [Tanacetum coccineum]